MSDFGVFDNPVATAGTIIAAGSAMTLAWKGRARWDPVEEDVPRGPQRVAGLMASLAIVIMWILATPESMGGLLRYAAIGACVTLVALLGYGYLIGSLTYKRAIALEGGQFADERVIGGFTLTPSAMKTVRQRGVTVQTYFSGTAYEKDAVWTRPSQALAKQAFVLAYVLLIAFGTTSLAAASIALRMSTKPVVKSQAEPKYTNPVHSSSPGDSGVVR